MSRLSLPGRFVERSPKGVKDAEEETHRASSPAPIQPLVDVWMLCDWSATSNRILGHILDDPSVAHFPWRIRSFHALGRGEMRRSYLSILTLCILLLGGGCKLGDDQTPVEPNPAYQLIWRDDWLVFIKLRTTGQCFLIDQTDGNGPTAISAAKCPE